MDGGFSAKAVVHVLLEDDSFAAGTDVPEQPKS
jgi:hypothetical protein